MVITHVGGVHMYNPGDIISYLIVIVPGRGKDLSTLTNGGMCQPSQMEGRVNPHKCHLLHLPISPVNPIAL